MLAAAAAAVAATAAAAVVAEVVEAVVAMAEELRTADVDAVWLKRMSTMLIGCRMFEMNWMLVLLLMLLVSFPEASYSNEDWLFIGAGLVDGELHGNAPLLLFYALYGGRNLFYGKRLFNVEIVIISC